MHGYDTPYNVALILNLNLSNLERLSVYRDKLCDDFLLKSSVNTEDKLFKYLPHNMNRDLVYP